uniref:Uncharacterized protein n=1 Tax=Sinocyclocheilus anshuiensis TaxID=1608454 RepID=A0A671K8W4_9TELE
MVPLSRLVLNKPLCVESFSLSTPGFEVICFLSGRFAVRDLKPTVAVEVIKSVEKVDQAKKTTQKARIKMMQGSFLPFEWAVT